MYEGPKGVCVVVECGGKNPPVPGRRRTRAVQLKFLTQDERGVLHGKEQLPDVVPDHVSRVVGLHDAKSGRANHRVTEGTAGQRAVMIDEIEVAHMPRAVLPHQK